ncbi:MAG: YraN family protein [Gammaproteobacteria bacterium]
MANRNYSAKLTGKIAEQAACKYLCQQGLKLITRNFRCRMGEIDLIMRQGKILVFVEVRYRQSYDYGGSLASVNYAKRQRLIKTAQYYLQVHNLLDQINCRFDVVALSGNHHVEWVPDAFWV